MDPDPSAPQNAGRSLNGLDFSPFARHYSGNKHTLHKHRSRICNLCYIIKCVVFFSFPPATKMFQFAGSSSHCPMNSGSGHPAFSRIGFPIRKSSGQRLLAASPRLIAGCYVLHRFLKSRHPPYTLNEIFPHFYFKSVYPVKFKNLTGVI